MFQSLAVYNVMQKMCTLFTSVLNAHQGWQCYSLYCEISVAGWDMESGSRQQVELSRFTGNRYLCVGGCVGAGQAEEKTVREPTIPTIHSR